MVVEDFLWCFSLMPASVLQHYREASGIAKCVVWFANIRQSQKRWKNLLRQLQAIAVQKMITVAALG